MAPPPLQAAEILAKANCRKRCNTELPHEVDDGGGLVEAWGLGWGNSPATHHLAGSFRPPPDRGMFYTETSSRLDKVKEGWGKAEATTYKNKIY